MISEHVIQRSFITELTYRKRQPVISFAIPNGGLRNIRVAQQMKAEGLLPGMPDNGFLFEDGQSAWLEFKTATGRLSDAQVGIRTRLEKLGHRWAMARSAEEAFDHLATWGLLK